jgi:hypothetical protein
MKPKPHGRLSHIGIAMTGDCGWMSFCQGTNDATSSMSEMGIEIPRPGELFTGLA